METQGIEPLETKASPWEQSLWVLLTVLTWAYLLVRAIKVPFVQDEANSVWCYLRPGEWLPFLSRPDAGNHFLSTLLGLIGYEVAGYSPVAIRWGSLAAFPFYAWACWLLVRPFPRLLRWCALLALLWCPFLLDFFALFRGYGISMAGWAWSLYALTRISPGGPVRHWWILTTALFVALFSNLSLLPVALIIGGSAALLAMDERKWRGPSLRRILPFLAFFLLMLAYAIAISLDLRKRDLLYLGTQGGILDTVRSLYHSIWVVEPSTTQMVVVVLPACLALLLATFRLVRTRNLHDPFVLLTGLLFADMAARWAMHVLLGTNYPVGRAALHWIPLYILVLAYACQEAGRKWRAAYVASLGLVIFPAWTIQDINTDRLIGQYELAIPKAFVTKVHALQDSLGRPLLLSGHFKSEWAFQQAAMGLDPIEMREDIALEDLDDVRVLAGSTVAKYGEGFHIVDRNSTGTVLLLLPDDPVQWTPVADTSLTSYEGSDEFIPVPIHTAGNGSGLLMKFKARITAEDRDADIQLVTEVKAPPDNLVRYEGIRFEHWTGLRSGAEVDVACYLPEVRQGQWAQAYVWNVRRSSFRMDDIQLEFLQPKAGTP